MNAAASACSSCSAALTPGQRYCLTCGERQGGLPAIFGPPAPAPRSGRSSLPGRRSFGAVGTVVLASGVLIGAAVGPALTPASLAATAGQLVVVASDAAADSSAPVAATAGASLRAPASLSAPTGNVSTPHHVVERSGPAPAAPAPAAPAAAAPAPAPAPKPDPPASDPVPEAPPEVPSVSGTVVHVSHEGKGYVLATEDGQLIALHTKEAPALGARLTTTVRALDNGTFRELKPTISGHAGQASLHGVVTFVDPTAGTYAVSARGVSMLVTSTAPTPPLDIAVSVEVDLSGPVRELKRDAGDPAAGNLDIEAIVREPDGAAPDHLIVSADDAGESPGTLTVTVPAAMDVTELRAPGTVIGATVKREADGSLTLVSAAADP